MPLILALVFAAAPGERCAPAPPEQAAEVICLTGQVWVMKDSVPGALRIGDTIQARQLVVTGSDGFANFEMSDGSAFAAYPNSQVAFRNHSGGWMDILDLWLGRVKVHVRRFGGRPEPNRVRTPTALISVRI